jgi:HK97 family phage major capsid protein
MDLEALQRKLSEQKPLQRILSVERETVNEDDRTIELSVSSEFPVERWFGMEILDHNTASIRWSRLNDGAAVRDTHYGDQIGVILRAWIDDKTKKLRVLMQFSKNTPRAVEVWKDVADGIRRNVSIRYMVHKLILEKEEENMDTYRATDWEPIHVSFEPDAADPTVGVGRSANDEGIIPIKLDAARDLEEQVNELNNNPEIKSKLQIVLTKNRSVQMTDEEKRQLEDQQRAAIDKAKEEGGEIAAKEASSISAMAREYAEKFPGINVYQEGLNFVQQKKSARDFSDFLLSKMKDPEATRKPSNLLGLTDKEVRQFSISRLIASADRDSNVKADFEREVSEAWRGKNRYAKESHLSIPPDVLLRGFGNRDLTVGVAAAGGNLKGTEHLAASFIEMARNKTVVAGLGAVILDGLTGDISIPTQTAATTVQWIGEDAAADQADPAFGQKTASPKTASANTAYSRKLLLQSSPAIDMLVESDLIKTVAIARDYAALQGAGGNAPVGISQTNGVGAIDGTGLNWAKIVEAEKKVQVANLDVNSMAYVTNPGVRAICKTRQKAENQAIYLMSEDGKLNGYNSAMTNQIAAANMQFGDYSQLVVCEWGGVDILVDPFTQAKKGQTIIVIFLSMDIVVRYAGAFVVYTGIN